MPRFNYRMQGILNIKYKMEEQAKTEFGLAQMRLNEEEEKLNNLVIRRAGYEQQARALRTGGTLKPLEMEEARRAIEIMKVMIRTQMMEVKKAEKAVDAARMKLQEAMQERKMHEKLKEKQFEMFKEELAAEEMKEVDQVVSYQYSSKDKSEE